MNIYVGNMNFNLKNEDLFNLFSQFGTVSTAKIIMDRETGRSKGFGFVEMDDEEEGRKAISSLNESDVMGRKLIVNEARPNDRQGGGGQGGGGFRKRPYGGGGQGGGGGFRPRGNGGDRFGDY
ncbi:MAG: RNA recognition motif domain-containing protein [bacterium]|jgi:RNA recognition motif-containing protein